MQVCEAQKRKEKEKKIDPVWEADRAGKLPADSVLEKKAFVLWGGLRPFALRSLSHLAWQLSCCTVLLYHFYAAFISYVDPETFAGDTY